MSIFYGSIGHTYSGRKRKTTRSRKTKLVVRSTATMPSYSNYRETPNYPSNTSASCNTTVDPQREEKLKIAQNYTVAVAYNKGAYQVISKANVKDIGK